MNKKVIIISVTIVVLLLISLVISYAITRGIDKKDEIKQDTIDLPVENKKQEANISSNKNEYTNINVDSQLAFQLLDFVPKYFQSQINKMNQEYMIYSAISKMKEENTKTVIVILDDNEFEGYSTKQVSDKAKEIFGKSIEITKKSDFVLPIGYSQNVYVIYPSGYTGRNEFQIIKEVKENKETFVLSVYVINTDYDVEDENCVYVETKDTYQLYHKGEQDFEKVRASMKKYVVSGIEVEPQAILKEYKDELPVIQYELQKLDERGIKYYLKDIKVIFN